MAKRKDAVIIGEIQMLPLNCLTLSDDNVRQIYAKDAIADLAADIRINGLIQSLSVRALTEPDGDVTHEVQGGGRRYRALQLLVKQKALAADAPIPCLPNETAIASQISLAENLTREALHPLDEYRAFAAMKAKGKSDDAIADAFRVSVHTVKQRLRMGTASPVLHKAFAAGQLSLQTLMAFCVTDSHERQERVWKQVKDQAYLNAYSIKQMLMEETVPASDKRVAFVGIDTYLKAGGVLEQDLFDEDNEGYLTNVDILNQLAQARLEREAEAFRAKGWKWAMAGISIPYADTSAFSQLTASNEELTDEESQRLEALEAEFNDLNDIDDEKRTKKQTKRLEVLTADIDAIENRIPAFSPEDMARAGVTLEIGSNGELHVEYGYVKPEDDVRADAGDDNAPASAPIIIAPDSEDEGSAKVPDGLVTDLTMHRTASLQAALAGNPDVAFLATLHAMVLSSFYPWGSRSPLQITTSTSFPSHAEGLKEFAPMKAMADQRKAWTARLPKDASALWDALTMMSREEQMQLLAYISAASLNVVVLKHEQKSGQVAQSHVLADALGYDIRKDWAPTADNFFKRVTKGAMLAAVTEARDEHTAELIAHLKKDAMAKEAERLLEGTGWLPSPMRARDQQVNIDEDNLIDSDEEDDGELPAFLTGDDATEATDAA